MKIIVDFEACEANGVCERVAPDLFRVEEDDTLTVLNQTPDASARDQLTAAVKGCPRAAIQIDET